MASTRSRCAGRGAGLLLGCAGALTLVLVVMYWCAVGAAPYERIRETDGPPEPSGIPLEPTSADVRGGSTGGSPSTEEACVCSADEALRELQVSGRVSYRVTETLPGAAKELVGCYRRESCLIMQAGYLDLFGNVWGCVLEGPGWVDLCVVREDESATSSSVRISRMGLAGKEAADALADAT